MNLHKKKYGKLLLTVMALLCFVSMSQAQKVVRYHLHIKDTSVNFTGKEKRAIAVNGKIPMPTLTFTQGDTAEIYVHNDLKESTSLHWHGVFLPNQEDGVPYLTQMPIEPGQVYVYRFPVIQHGTHWYHSHSGLQEQLGMYGPLIFEKRSTDPSFRKGIDDLPTTPVVLSEWTDYHPHNVERMLHNASDWFAMRKNAVQSYGEAISAGHFKTKIANEWKRMLAMDVSDVYYDKFLLNGRSDQTISPGSKGSRVRLRIANGGASTNFWLRYAGGKITVVANDGNDVEPIEVDRLLIAVSETYDVVVSIPNSKIAYEFLATSEDRIGSASLYIGEGVRQLISPLPRLKYFEGMKMMNGMMKMNGDLDDMGMNMSLNQMDMNVVMYPEITGEAERKGRQKESMDKETHNMASHGMEDRYNSNKISEIVTLNYAMLKSPDKTTLPSGPMRELRFELTGNMNRYVWSMDNKVLSESDRILIQKGENVRIVLFNNSMMRHPMHLHGHDFRALNGMGDYAPLKNIIDIMPMETDTLEFRANVYGDWFFHCHILYHMMSGMNRVFSYQDQPKNPLIKNPSYAQRKLFADERAFHFMAENDIATNGNDGMLMFQNTRWSIGTEWRLGYNDMHGYETETHIGRYIGRMQWLMVFAGFDWRYRKDGIDSHEENIFGQRNSKDDRAQLTLGFSYTLPMLVKFQTEVFQSGNVRLQFMREDIPITKRIRAGFMVNSDAEYMAEISYIFNPYLGIRTHFDSDMGFGVGLKVNY